MQTQSELTTINLPLPTLRSAPSNGVSVRRVIITPDDAKELLTHIDLAQQRPLDPKQVEVYRRDMLQDNWLYNGTDSVVVSRSGRLLNGQHTCHAVIAAGVPIEVNYVVGVEDAAFATIDMQKKRSTAEVMRSQGHPHYSALAPATTLLWQYEQGIVPGSSGSAGHITNSEKLSIIDRHPELATSAEIVINRLNGNGILRTRRTILIAAHYWASRVNKASATSFVDQLITGQNISSSQPAFHIRSKMLAAKGRPSRDTRDINQMAVKALNAHLRGETIRRLVIGTDEEFPSVYGYKKFGHLKSK